ncbi:MAG: ABC-2 family transporter protein [Acidimicrobiia bacterium]|nr:ABC-2 family transporter protein [Acidimicrobiia bacterium]
MTNRPSSPTRLAILHWKIGALNEMQYRLNFWVQLFNSAIALATGLIAIALVYGQTNSLAGWSQPELLAVMGVHIIIGGILKTFIQPNMNRLMDDVQQGTLDYALTRPADAQLMVSVKEVSLWSAIDIVLGLGVVGWSISELTSDVRLLDAIGFLFALVCGALIIYALWLSVSTISFKVIRTDSMMQLLNGIYEAGRWPVTVYPALLRASLTFLIPLAFAVTVPAEAISGRINWWMLAVGALVTIAALAGSRQIWKWGIRNYAGASA